MSITSSLLRFGLALKGLKMRSKIVISGLTPDVETTFYKVTIAIVIKHFLIPYEI